MRARLGGLGPQVREPRGRQHEADGRLERGDPGGAGPPVDQRELPERRPRRHAVEPSPAALAAHPHVGADLPSADEVEAVGLIALVEDDRPEVNTRVVVRFSISATTSAGRPLSRSWSASATRPSSRDSSTPWLRSSWVPHHSSALSESANRVMPSARAPATSRGARPRRSTKPTTTPVACSCSCRPAALRTRAAGPGCRVGGGVAGTQVVTQGDDAATPDGAGLAHESSPARLELDRRAADPCVGS